jgi:hypothetical protein
VSEFLRVALVHFDFFANHSIVSRLPSSSLSSFSLTFTTRSSPLAFLGASPPFTRSYYVADRVFIIDQRYQPPINRGW